MNFPIKSGGKKQRLQLFNLSLFEVKMKKVIVFCFIAIGYTSGYAQPNEGANPFFCYNFGGLERYSPEEQIDILYKTGFDGICLQMAKAEEVRNLDCFIRAADRYADFKIYSAFVRYNFEDEELDKNRWKQVVDKIQGKSIALWFIFGKPQPGITHEHVERILRRVVNYAESKQVPVVLYPHSTCYFFSAEQALPTVQKINHPNLTLAVHSCHEMRAGNGNRLDQVVLNVKNYISFVTIAGADNEIDRTSAFTIDRSTIQPLDKGNYDYSKFLNALRAIEYKGPVGFINFKIDKQGIPVDVYLQETLTEWKGLKSKYLNYKE